MNAESDVTKETKKNELWEWVKAFLFALALVFIVRMFLFAPTVVSGPSMQPNFYDHERLIVNKIIYRLGEPDRGDVIIFHATHKKDYVKRVIALPGETIQVSGDHVYVNGQLLDEPYIREQVQQRLDIGKKYNTLADFPETVVPEGHVFVLGDNRPNSTDSRFREIGFVPMSAIVGKVQLVFWPISEIKWVHDPEFTEVAS